MTNVVDQYPLCSKLIKNQIASKTCAIGNLEYVMNNTPRYVLDAFEHHLQGEDQ